MQPGRSASLKFQRLVDVHSLFNPVEFAWTELETSYKQPCSDRVDHCKKYGWFTVFTSDHAAVDTPMIRVGRTLFKLSRKGCSPI
jgi:hypothetical protein